MYYLLLYLVLLLTLASLEARQERLWARLKRTFNMMDKNRGRIRRLRRQIAELNKPPQPFDPKGA